MSFTCPLIRDFFLSSLQETDRAHVPYIPTSPKAGPTDLHRPSRHLGSSPHIQTDGDTQTIPSAFLDHHGVFGRLHIPLLSSKDIAPPDTQLPRVPMFQYPIPEHTLEEWKAQVAVDSHSSTTLAKAMTLSLLDSLDSSPVEISPQGHKEMSQITTAHILDLANHLQSIPWEAMDTATSMFPHRIAPAPSRNTLSRHLWPNSVRHDVANIRRRANAIRRLVRLAPKPQHATPEDISSSPTHISLWSSVNMPPQLRTVLSPTPQGLDTLGLLNREDLSPYGKIPPTQALQTCFKGL